MRRARTSERRQGRVGAATGDRGAAIVEFALIVPLLFLLIFGIIEFGSAQSQQLNLRHGGREAARLAAVNYRTTATATGTAQSIEIVNETCARIDVARNATVTLSLPAGPAIGSSVQVTVQAPLKPITGFIPSLDNKTLRSTVSSRLERTATFAAITNRACP